MKIDNHQHRKRVKHYHRSGELHELTFSCYQRRPLLTNDLWRQFLARTIDSANEELNVLLAAFVFMPEHVHLLVSLPEGERIVSRYLARVKQPFSKQIKQRLEAGGKQLLQDLTVRERPGKTCFRFWQEGPGYDRNIIDANTLQIGLDYVHMNPVQRGLCSRPVDWKWSSARWYASQLNDHDLPRIHGLRPDDLDSMGFSIRQS